MKLHYTHFDHYTSKLTFSCDCSGTGIQLLQKLEELLNCSCDFWLKLLEDKLSAW